MGVKSTEVAIVQPFVFPYHNKCGKYDEYGRWFPDPALNFDNVFKRFASYPSPLAPNSYISFFYSLRYARLLARDRPYVYRKYHHLPPYAYLVLFPAQLEMTKRKRRKKKRKKKATACQVPEAHMYQYIQVSAPFSTTPRWFSICRIRNDHRLAERYAARLKVPEHCYGPDDPPKAGIRHVRVFTYTAAKRVFDDDREARYFMYRCSEEIKNGYREEEIPEYLDRETGETKKVTTMHPLTVVKELRRLEVALMNNRMQHVKGTDVVVPITEKTSKTVVVKDIPNDLYEEMRKYAVQEGLAVGNWIKTAIESHIQGMRYREVSYDKEIFPNLDISQDEVVFDTPEDGESVVIDTPGDVRYVIDF